MNQDDKIPKFFCLVCEKELRSLAWGITPLCCIENGGVLDISMGYGSNYDQEILWEPVGGYDSIPLITEETKEPKPLKLSPIFSKFDFVS